MKQVEKAERFKYFYHETGSIVRDVSTGRVGPCQVREVASETLGLFADFGQGFERVSERNIEVIKPIFYGRRG